MRSVLPSLAESVQLERGTQVSIFGGSPGRVQASRNTRPPDQGPDIVLQNMRVSAQALINDVLEPEGCFAVRIPHSPVTASISPYFISFAHWLLCEQGGRGCYHVA